jgi:hypothetical protein
MWARRNAVPLLTGFLGAFAVLAVYFAMHPLPASKGGASGVLISAPVSEEEKKGLLETDSKEKEQVQDEIRSCEADIHQSEQMEMPQKSNDVDDDAVYDCRRDLAQMNLEVIVLETYIARLQTGNVNMAVCEANGGASGCESLWIPAGVDDSSSTKRSHELEPEMNSKGYIYRVFLGRPYYLHAEEDKQDPPVYETNPKAEDDKAY